MSMVASLGSILATLQNGVTALNGLRTQVAATFPQIRTVSSASRGSNGAITFDSSAAVGFIAVTTSSGAVGYVALYPSS
jgi:hypothetical protein